MEDLAHGAAGPRLNVTPMIDVLLVLIIIFMLAMSEHGQMPVQLPGPISGTAGSRAIVLTIQPGGRYAINRQAIAPGALSQQIHQIFDGRPEKLLYIDGARNASYQEVMQGMDIAVGAGVTVLAAAPAGARAP